MDIEGRTVSCLTVYYRFQRTEWLHRSSFIYNHCWNRQPRKTRYGWVANPYPSGTFTRQEASSFAWRTNALLTGKLGA